MITDKMVNKIELYRLLSPFIFKVYSKYAFFVFAHTQKERISCFLNKLKKSSFERSTELVKKQYDESWKNNDLTSKRKGLARWGDKYFYIEISGISYLHLFCIKQIIDFLHPADIFEIGFGRGGKLLPLAAAFPDKRIGGIELSTSGFNEALKLIKKIKFPDEFKKNIPFHINEYDSLESVNLFNGSAQKIPVSSKSYDFVYTSQALEQMECIRDEVMFEIVRIARKYVLMIEPFRDWNDTGMHRNRILSRNYFQAKIDDLPRYGLKPIYINNDLPSKIYMNVGIVLAEVL